MLRSAVALVLLAAACGDPPPRIHVTRMEVAAGEPVVVHLEAAGDAPRAGRLWLTLAPAGAPESFVGDRVVVERDATHVTVPTAAPGRWEVRLHDGFPSKTHHLVARARVQVYEGGQASASATFVSE